MFENSSKRLYWYAAVALIVILAAAVFLFAYTHKKQTRTAVGNSAAQLQALSDLVYKSHDYTSALSQADQLLKNAPNDAQIWLLKGVSQFYLNQADAAQASFTKVLAIDPSSATASYYQGKLQSGLVLITSAAQTQQLSNVDVQSKIGVTFDPKILTFRDSMILPPGDHYTDFDSATYVSTDSPAALLAYLKTVIKPAATGDKITTQSNSGQNTLQKSNDQTKVYIAFRVSKSGSGSLLSITYNKAK